MVHKNNKACRLRVVVKSAMMSGASFIALSSVAAEAQDDSASNSQREGLEEIVVTARKFAESLQDAPLAVTAISGETLETRNIANIANLSSIAPNLLVNLGAGRISAVTVSIRGITTGTVTNFTADSPIGLYLDGVYLGRSTGALFDVLDLERVEVLRGPQGTLFGRNTTGGAVVLISRKPDSELKVSQKVTYGTFGEWSSRTRVNLGELGKTGLNMSIAYLHRAKAAPSTIHFSRTSSIQARLTPIAFLGPSAESGEGLRSIFVRISKTVKASPPLIRLHMHRRASGPLMRHHHRWVAAHC